MLLSHPQASRTLYVVPDVSYLPVNPIGGFVPHPPLGGAGDVGVAVAPPTAVVGVGVLVLPGGAVGVRVGVPFPGPTVGAVVLDGAFPVGFEPCGGIR